MKEDETTGLRVPANASFYYRMAFQGYLGSFVSLDPVPLFLP